MHIKIDYKMYMVIKHLYLQPGDIVHIENETSSIGNYNVTVYSGDWSPEAVEQLKHGLIEESGQEKPKRLRGDGRE